MSSKRDKTTGLPLPSPVDPGSTICVTLQIPDAPEYRQAFRGFVADLGKFWTWSRTVGQDDSPAREAAQLWRVAANTITYSDDCEGTMSCYDVANCIETNPATQAALNGLFGSGPGQTNVYNTSYIGAPMLAAQRNTVIAKDFEGDCRLDELFGSVTTIVDQLNQNNSDFLELILLTDNAQQRVSKIIKAIPLLNQVPIDEMLDFASQMSTEIKENYDAQYTTALRDTYRCDIFCLAQDAENCEITFQMLVEYFNDRIGTSLEPINFFGSLVQYFISGTWAGTTVVDIMTLIQLSVWQEASNWLGVSLRTLQTVGLLGANDPDHDWAVIPCECAPENPVIIIDLEGGPFKDNNYGGTVEYLGGTRWKVTMTVSSVGSDWRITIKAEDDVSFKIINRTTTGTIACTAWQDGGFVHFDGCSFNPNYYNGETTQSILWTGTGAAYVEFDAVAP